MRSAAARPITTCPRFAGSCAIRLRRITASRRSSWAWSTARRFRSESRWKNPTIKEQSDHVHYQDVVAPADFPARHGRHPGAAAARIDGAGADGHGEDGGQPAAPVRGDFRAARRAAGLLDAEDRRPEL